VEVLLWREQVQEHVLEEMEEMVLEQLLIQVQL
jgi:hypothetical protein